MTWLGTTTGVTTSTTTPNTRHRVNSRRTEGRFSGLWNLRFGATCDHKPYILPCSDPKKVYILPRTRGTRGTIFRVATKFGQVAQEITVQNIWWRKPHDWKNLDPDLQEVSRSGLEYRSDVLDGLVPGNVYLLLGPRRVGKTVEVKQSFAALLDSGVPPRSIVRVAVDGWAAKDLRTLAQNIALPRL